jgi:hypothetical protein
MTQSKYLITTTNTPNSIVKRDQAGDIQGNGIVLNDYLNCASVTASDFLDAAGAALFIDGAAATFQVPIDANGVSVTANNAVIGLGGISNGGVITHSYTNIGTISANQDLSFELFTVIELTVGANITLSNTVCPPAGTECTLILVTSGTTSRTVIFSASSFRITGTLATGTLTGRRFVLTFVSDGTELVEKSRTTASV